ncbi:MAG: hypothetical protein PHT95_05345, partial [Candidatus Omnitrophica bacterium]|nr:hypothetical protein [Candidatus Omnitrophota bacterium]
NAYESAKTTYEDVVKAMVTGWLMKAREKADPAVWEQAVNNWQLLMSAYLKQFEKSAREAGIALKADLRAPPAEATEEMLRQVMGTVSTEFSAIFQSAVQNVQRTTPGQQAVRTVVNDVDDLYESLTPAQHEGINAVIKSVIDAGAYQTGSLRVRVRNEATGKMEYQEVVVYRLEGLKEAIETYNVNPTFGEAIPLDLEVHPGRGVDHSGSNLYMSRAAADALNNRQLQRLARHEVYHILNPDRTEQQAIDAMKDDLEDVRERFRSVEAARVAAKGIPEVSVYDESALESKLAADTSYGAAAAKHIQAAKTKIAAVKSEGNAAEAARLENELRQWMKTVEARRGNIDRMQNVLTDENYNGYDVIIVSSSTPDEAEYQQKVLEGLFAGRQTSNKELGNQVCILSVLDESEGGQIIGQGLSWLRAVEMYRDWAIKNGLEATDLDALFSQDKIKIAVYHNGGKGERASPATQSLGNSRGAQKIVGTVTAANGERADIELIPAVILSTAGAAITNNGSRVDTFWANQVSFGTIDLANLQRSNSQFDKLVIKLPADPKKKDLFDYGTAVINDYIVKFLANKSLTVKNPATGQFEDNPKFEKELSELLRSPNGSFDFGSFSMSRDMHYALIEYWKNKGIFDKIERDKKAGIARDIDPAFVQIVVPLMSGLMGKDMPAGLPTADELRVMTPEQREAALNDVYAKLVALMPADHAAALDKIYNAQKKGELDKDKRDSVLESIEFLIMYPQLFGDRSKVVGSIDLGADSHWFAYKRMLDLSNEKFLMLSDILGKNVELNGRGEVVETPLDALNLDEVRAEDARRIRGINRDAVATFVVNGELITLTLDQVREGWRDAKNDITVKGSIIHGNTVLMPGSKVINSVISDSQGKIVATNSYVESSVAVEIDAANSIVYKASDKDVVKADKEIVADAYRAPDREGNVQISDERFPAGLTRMRAPIGYDPKPSNPVLNAAGEMIQDDKRFGDNRYSFQDIRNMECNRAANDEVETTNKDAVRMGAGMVLPGMAAGLSFEEAYGFVVKEAAEKIERIREMDPKYVSLKNGTSGMRGMVAQSEAESALIKPEMTPEQIENTRERISRQIASEGFMSDMECYINVRGFIRFLYAQGDIVKGSTIVFGGDRRPSTPRIAAAIQQAIVDEGCVPECAGLVSSPALAYYAVQNGIPSVMITGSHIPADRNGIKFTKKSGEVLKSDEMPIASGVRAARNDVYGMRPDLRLFNDGGMFKPNSRPEVQVNSKKDVMEFYVQRYLSALPSDYLKGARMVLYQHSAVGRDALEKIFRGLGAEVITIGRSETFV